MPEDSIKLASANCVTDSRTCTAGPDAKLLNRDCYCLTVDEQRLREQLLEVVGQDVLQTHPQLFSNTSAYVTAEQVRQMAAIIEAVARLVALPVYREKVLSRAPEIARFVPPGQGVFMGYDFHLSPSGPKVIEINTNAGGAIINTALLQAQIACCPGAEGLVPVVAESINMDFVQMFRNEWQRLHPQKPLRQITIVDDAPLQQYLYPEFIMAKALFQRQGIDAVIAAPEELSWRDGALWHQESRVELLYNRLTDFYLAEESHALIREAYLYNAVVLTPNPRVYALYADKSNLALFSDAALLQQWGVEPADIETLVQGFPEATLVTEDKRDALWARRNSLFFKPLTGFGGRATYRGDKMTRGVWEGVRAGGYIAQQRVAPSERGVSVNGQKSALKLDLRAYAYGAQLQLLAARLYQGQTTNFRTSGGGFAPVFVAG